MAEKKGKKVSITPKSKAKGGKKGSKRAKKDFFGLVDLPDDLTESAREIWLAGLGALATVEEEGGKVFKSLVAKGEQWEKEGRKKVGAARAKLDAARDTVEDAAGDVVARGSKATQDLDHKIIAKVEDSVESVLQRLGVPTRAEVKDLAGKVDKLSQQVSALAAVMEQEKQSATND